MKIKPPKSLWYTTIKETEHLLKDVKFKKNPSKTVLKDANTDIKPMKSKPKTKSKSKSKSKLCTEDAMYLELDGGIYIVDKVKGKEAVKEEIDGNVILALLLQILTNAIEKAVEEEEMKKVPEFIFEDDPQSISKSTKSYVERSSSEDAELRINDAVIYCKSMILHKDCQDLDCQDTILNTVIDTLLG